MATASWSPTSSVNFRCFSASLHSLVRLRTREWLLIEPQVYQKSLFFALLADIDLILGADIDAEIPTHNESVKEKPDIGNGPLFE